ncbi:glycoside hydrolase family 2 protein [Bacteroides sp. 214]|uniref:sugar-binding domain-containing protein n=1 Tax=Bacteroides sp. 214 TaxID=2302935 RepID=UPI0013D7F964|nr:sugar-binding domain-containing protein [Bacteroides sp. 214]NDW11400.1 glycoside hydrolase family 2 protein [Bacteroides sp. 214]
MRIVTTLLLVVLFTSQAFSQRKVLFDNDWRFQLGIQQAEQPTFNDASWRIIDLPHDWGIEHLPNQEPGKVVGPFSKESAGGFATGNTVGGEGWYRKSFVIPKEDANKRHELYFEGIYNQSEIWVNGQKVYRNVYGYTTFRVDITPYCNRAGKENTIAVRVLNEGKNSRWYTGSGIYRHVWLIRTASSYLEDWGTFIHTASVQNQQADISLSTTVVNSDKKEKDYTVNVTFISPKGEIVAQSSSQTSVAKGSKVIVPFEIQVQKPLLWNTDAPHLYEVKISLWNNNIKEDEYVLPFGIRTIQYSVEKGFELNGVPTLLKGGCVHHDNGLLGSASFDRAEERKIQLLKQNGYNAVRGSHNPMSESFMNACDRLGMLVIDEAFDQWRSKKNDADYHLYFDEWSAKDLQNLVLRDRNRPSVIMWSIGNEIRERISERGKATALYLKNEILQFDNTRPITAGVNKYWNKDRTAMIPLDNAFYHLDIAGYNYMWRFFEEKHVRFPERIMYSSESVATEAAGNWDKVERLPYVIGDFIWTAMDYLGESGLGNSFEVDPQENVHQFMEWPWFNGWCGDIDLIGIKKPQSYYRDVLWRERAISMAVETPVPAGKIKKVSFWGWREESLSWTFPEFENDTLKVNVYTRAAGVRLYLNNTLVGEQTIDTLYTASFRVPYQPGILRAVEVNNNIEGASTVLQTQGKPAALRLTPDKSQLKADGQDLSYVLIELIDEQGNVLLNTDRKIEIECNGNGTIIASGNASPTDMESFGSSRPMLFKGRAMAIIRAGKETGTIEVRAAAEGMKETKVTLSTH